MTTITKLNDALLLARQGLREAHRNVCSSLDPAADSESFYAPALQAVNEALGLRFDEEARSTTFTVAELLMIEKLAAMAAEVRHDGSAKDTASSIAAKASALLTFSLPLTFEELIVLKAIVDFHSDDEEDVYFSKKGFDGLKRKIVGIG